MSNNNTLSTFFTTMQAAKRERITIIKRGEPGWQDYSAFKGLFPSQAQRPWMNNKRRGT